MTEPGKRVDPADWSAFRRAFHDLADQCVDRLESARNLPWIPKPDDMARAVALRDAEPGADAATVFSELAQGIMPYATGNTHPAFFGWVHGTGQPAGVAAEMVAATMNANLGGRDHGAIEVERAVIDWTRRQAGLPQSASGILTTGTSQATLLALCAARMRLMGDDVRRDGIADLGRIRVYAVEGAHYSIAKALEIMGHGSRAVRYVAQEAQGAMDLRALAAAVDDDRAAGIRPMAVVGTAGAVDTGLFDPIDALADFCAAEDIWYHVDGAFGFWAVLADTPWCDLMRGVGRADSIATDFHKWIGAPYDCGLCLMADGDLHRRSFATRPPYLEGMEDGLGGGSLWFCDYGLDLSRGFRALKVWATIRAVGRARLADSITDNCRQAALLGSLVTQSSQFDLVRPVQANVCCFAPRNADAGALATALQLSGEAVFSTTRVDDRTCLRAAIVNHRTTDSDVRTAFAALERQAAAQ
ncbi:pyridoxal phosphate-dependent decarboxylase family protein [Roseovarius aestuariivivens]|uniref:pyridoxal phosphate-dependent decarboxylase family protein n=1 Tax=Roseovarius aestuariivivens TaxID=1888910 RepID=UPI0010819E79|nr:pyridoxal-dependent decarboxylase [Roseovarius aestuariivivens]